MFLGVETLPQAPDGHGIATRYPVSEFGIPCFMMTELLWRSYVSTRAEIPARGLHFLTLDWIYALYFVGKADLDC
jgi:hypothetical protein